MESDIGILLRSKDPKENVVALSGLISALSRGCDISEYLPYVIQLITSPDVNTARAVYTILAHTSGSHQREALMSVNELQKAASQSSNQLVRAMAIRTLSNVRVYDIFEVAKMSVLERISDPSPFVRKIALYGLMKLHAILYDTNPAEVEALFTAYDKRACELNSERIYKYVQNERNKRLEAVYDSIPNSREILKEAKEIEEKANAKNKTSKENDNENNEGENSINKENENNDEKNKNLEQEPEVESEHNSEHEQEPEVIDIEANFVIPTDDIFYTQQISTLCPHIDAYSLLQHHIDLTAAIKPLLKDPVVSVSGAAVSTLNAVCPNRLDLIHQVYKSVCCLVADVDEWCQADVLAVLERYCRYCFESSFFHPVLIIKIDQKEKEKEKEKEIKKQEKEITPISTNSFKLNVDLITATTSARVLLSSRNSSVVLAAASLIYHCYPVPEVFVMTNPMGEMERAVLYDIRYDAPRRPEGVKYSTAIECMLAQTHDTVHDAATALMRLAVQAPREEKFIVLRALHTVAKTFPQLFFGVYADVPPTCSIAHVLQIIVANTSPLACSSASPNLTGSATQNNSSMVSNFIVSQDVLSSLQDLFVFTDDSLPVKTAKLEVLSELTPLYRDSAVLVLRELEDYLTHTYYCINGSNEQTEFERRVVCTISKILVRAIMCNKQLDDEITVAGTKLAFAGKELMEKAKKLDEIEKELEELKKEEYQLTIKLLETNKSKNKEIMALVEENKEKITALTNEDAKYDVKEYTPAKTIYEDCEKTYCQLMSYRRVLSFIISSYLRTLMNVLMNKPVTSAIVQQACIQLPEVIRLLYNNDKINTENAEKSYYKREPETIEDTYKVDNCLFSITAEEKRQLESLGLVPITPDTIQSLSAENEAAHDQEVIRSRRIFPSTLNLPAFLDPLKVHPIVSTKYNEEGEPVSETVNVYLPTISKTTIIPSTKVQRIIASILIKLIHIGDKFSAPQVSQDDVNAVESTQSGSIYKPESGNDFYFDPIKKELIDVAKFCSTSSSSSEYGIGTVTELSVAARVSINNILSNPDYINMCATHIVEYLRRRIARIADEPAPVKASLLKLAHSVYSNRDILKYGSVYQQQRRTLDDIDYVIAFSIADKTKNEYIASKRSDIPQSVMIFSKIQNAMQSRVQKITERYNNQGTMEIIPVEAVNVIARNTSQAIEAMYKYVLDVLLQDEAFELRDLTNLYLTLQKDEENIKDDKSGHIKEEDIYKYIKILQIYQTIGEENMKEYYYNKECDNNQYSAVITRFIEKEKIDNKHVYQPLSSNLVSHEMSISSVSHALSTEIPKFIPLEPWKGDSPNDLRKVLIDIDASISRKKNSIIKEIETARSKIEAHKVKESLSQLTSNDKNTESSNLVTKQMQLFNNINGTNVKKLQTTKPVVEQEVNKQQIENLNNVESLGLVDDSTKSILENKEKLIPENNIIPQQAPIIKKPSLVVKPLITKPPVIVKPVPITPKPPITPISKVEKIEPVQIVEEKKQNDDDDDEYYYYDESEAEEQEQKEEKPIVKEQLEENGFIDDTTSVIKEEDKQIVPTVEVVSEVQTVTTTDDDVLSLFGM